MHAELGELALERGSGGKRKEKHLRAAWSKRLMGVLTWLVLAATGVAVVLMAVIAADPTVPFNPYPPPTPSPVPTPVPTATRTPAPPTATPTATSPPFATPTPLHPATLTPTPGPTMPFSFTVEYGPSPPALDCTAPFLAGAVVDQEEQELVDYPIHVWGPSLDTIVRSGNDSRYGPSGWRVDLPADAGAGVWYVQLHLYNIYRAHPPLSPIVQVRLDDNCRQALILFRASP